MFLGPILTGHPIEFLLFSKLFRPEMDRIAWPENRKQKYPIHDYLTSVCGGGISPILVNTSVDQKKQYKYCVVNVVPVGAVIL